MEQSLLETSLTASSTSSSNFMDHLMTPLSSLLQVGVEFLSGSHSVQFTGLVLINKIIDTALATNERVMNYDTINVRRFKQDKLSKKKKKVTVTRARTWREVIQQSLHQSPPSATDNEDAAAAASGDGTSFRPIIELLSEKVHAGKVLSLVLNAITLHRRVVGTRFRCTPSLRIRQCSYHCLQILSARLLLYLAQSATSRAQLMEEAPLRMMVEALDYTLDPQLLCLVIQTVALLALHYPYQSLLLSSGIPDALTQLVLPSDEWYYTNHTTRFSRVVKHHAARALVYLGLARCLGPRVSLFDYQGTLSKFI